MRFISNTTDIIDSVAFFQRVFQITVALALGESFKQFVADESRAEKEDPSRRHLHFDRLPALCTFLCTIIPFFHGMSRYFYLTYLRTGTSLPETYALQLSFDSFCFVVESALFFTLARALVLSRLRAF